MLIVDSHLDMAFGALRFRRDLTRPLSDLHKREGKRPPQGVATVSLPALFEGGVAIVFGTVYSMPVHANKTLPDNLLLVYRNDDEAHAAGMAQLDYYWRLADENPRLRMVGDLATLEEVVASNKEPEASLLGIVPLMEGADPVRDPAELALWYERGVRLIGPAWDDTRYAHGAWRGRGGFTPLGHDLMDAMADLGFILDITHLSEKATFEALDRYEGVVVATHSNVRALVPGERQLSDVQIRRLAERDGVMGVVLFNRFLKAGYSSTDRKESVTLDDVVAHIDHVCQMLGDARHVGIGSDLDGGFGRDDTPQGIDSIADLGALIPALGERGYSDDDIAQIMGGNWVRTLRTAFGA